MKAKCILQIIFTYVYEALINPSKNKGSEIFTYILPVKIKQGTKIRKKENLRQHKHRDLQ